MPSFDTNGNPVNGGIPQRANRSLHFSVLAATFDKFVPAGDDRILDFDFENWNPVWARNSNTSAYQNSSRLLVSQAHPTWDMQQIEAQAKLEFESSAKQLLIDTILYIKKLRPSIKVGSYSFPSREYWNGYNSSSGDALRADNNALFPLWCSMDALFPSVYQFYNSCNSSAVRSRNAEYVRSNVAEAVRIASEIKSRCGRIQHSMNTAALTVAAPPVWVYTWHRYHDGVELLCDADEEMYWTESVAAGATGIILWGNEPKTVAEFKKYWAEDFAPLANSWK